MMNRSWTLPTTVYAEGERHERGCQSNLAACVYDDKCFRCQKIKKVTALRRKTISNGASLSEQVSAFATANAIVVKYKLTRGEILDHDFAPEITAIKAKVYNANSKAKTTRRVSGLDA